MLCLGVCWYQQYFISAMGAGFRYVIMLILIFCGGDSVWGFERDACDQWNLHCMSDH